MAVVGALVCGDVRSDCDLSAAPEEIKAQARAFYYAQAMRDYPPPGAMVITEAIRRLQQTPPRSQSAAETTDAQREKR